MWYTLYKLLQSSFLLLHFWKNFSRQSDKKNIALYYPKGRFSPGGSEKALFYSEGLVRKKKAIYSPSARNIQRNNQFFFPQILKCVTSAVWKWLVKVDMICPKCILIKENVFFPQSLMRQIEKTKLLLAQTGQTFFQPKGFNLSILLI